MSHDLDTHLRDRQRSRREHETRQARERKQSETPRRESPLSRVARERRERREALIAHQIETGELRVRFASDEEKAEWARQAAARRASYRPDGADAGADGHDEGVLE